MKLEGIRNKIDKIDRELLVLLQERMGLALRSRKFQDSAGDSKPEEDTLERMKHLNLDLVKSSFSRQLLKTIIESCVPGSCPRRSVHSLPGVHRCIPRR